MKIHNFEQGSPEWFAIRLGKFTASKASAVATNGKGLETLVFEKVAEILTQKLPEPITNADMERGKELEKNARSEYEMETGNIVNEVGFCEEDEFVGCSPDGTVGTDGLVEIKCPKDSVYARYLYDEKVDSKYDWQMQMQMLVTGREWVDYVVYNPNFKTRPIVIKRIPRNEVKISKLKVGLAQGKANLQAILKKVK